MILILSNKWDLTVDFVVAELRSRGSNFIRFNTEDLASGRATICLPDLRILVSKHGRVHDLTRDINVIWYRRPGKPFDDIPTGERPSLATQNFVNDQWYSWLEAIQLIPNITWINHPKANDAIENKARQLLIASKLGFEIPETVITNDKNDAIRLAQEHDNYLIAKALYSPLIEEPDEDFFVFTNIINDVDLLREEEMRVSPTIFQQALVPKIDYRVTVVGQRVFAVRIERLNEKPLQTDWRMEKDDLRFLPCNLPPDVDILCQRYVDECDLLFGAIDLVQHEEKFFFLEINPNGEWGWLQKPNNIPIAETLCDLLIFYDTKDGA
ncbi:MAG: hypothetical protein JRJ38_10545 [Deltaproteobacteria bacterium]|nr:hypothetical protein [Deltaproteobacteria bacterium]